MNSFSLFTLVNLGKGLTLGNLGNLFGIPFVLWHIGRIVPLLNNVSNGFRSYLEVTGDCLGDGLGIIEGK